MWYVYFLRLNNEHVYVGSTNDLQRRIASHEKGRETLTRAYLPVELESYIAVKTEEHVRISKNSLKPDQARHSRTSAFGSVSQRRSYVGQQQGLGANAVNAAAYQRGR